MIWECPRYIRLGSGIKQCRGLCTYFTHVLHCCVCMLFSHATCTTPMDMQCMASQVVLCRITRLYSQHHRMCAVTLPDTQAMRCLDHDGDWSRNCTGWEWIFRALYAILRGDVGGAHFQRHRKNCIQNTRFGNCKGTTQPSLGVTPRRLCLSPRNQIPR